MPLNPTEGAKAAPAKKPFKINKHDEEITIIIINSKSITIRDIDGGETPFIYSSGNRGPGYNMIKGLSGQPRIFKHLIAKLAKKIANTLENNGDVIDFVDGNATGGMICGWELRNQLESYYSNLPYVYLRESRKKGGHNELITGNMHNSLITKGMSVLVVEELVNFGQTTVNAVDTFRRVGYKCKYAATLMHYDLDETNQRLEENNITLISLITLPKLLHIAKKCNLLDIKLVDSYLEFLENPISWQLDRHMVIPTISAVKAIDQGYNMQKLSKDEALTLGAPKIKVDQGIEYWVEKVEHKVFIALDYSQDRVIEEPYNFITGCKSNDYGFKINLDSLLTFSNNILTHTPHDCIQRIKNYGRLVFADIKIWNGLRTMSNIVRECVNLGVDIISVYPHVGISYLMELAKITKGTETKLFVLTVLTHYDDEYCKAYYRRSLKQTVVYFANLAEDAGADGIILPATCLDYVQHNPLLKMCPGIRPYWYQPPSDNNQVQIATPEYAGVHGANYIVVGSPITKSENKIDALQKIIDEFKVI